MPLWNLDRLLAPPPIEFADGEGSVRGVWIENEPRCGRPTRVFAYLGVPVGLREPAPAMLLAHGGGGRAFREWVAMWVARGYVALAPSFGGHGPDGSIHPDAGPPQDHPAIFQNDDPQEAWPYHAVAAALRGVSLLASLPETDASRIGMTGISWGGYLTCCAAGLDPRLRAAVPVYGCGFLHENSCWLPEFAAMSPERRENWIAAFDPSRHLPRARLPMLWVNGTHDFAYPLDSYQKSYRLAPGPRTLCVTVRMPHSHEDGWKPGEIARFVDHRFQGGTPLPALSEARRDGDVFAARIVSETGIRSAQIHWTCDSGAWTEREWTSAPAEASDGTLTATIPPKRPIVYFCTATDERGATVSSEHETLE